MYLVIISHIATTAAVGTLADSTITNSVNISTSSSPLIPAAASPPPYYYYYYYYYY
jgi:hypothetical protein